MNRLRLNLIVEVLMFVVLVVNIFAAVNKIRDLHKVMGWTLFAFVVLHLLLHFRQIIAMVKSFLTK